MSSTHYVISSVVARTWGRHDSTAVWNRSFTFSVIPRTFYSGKDHIPTSLPKIQPVSNIAWRKKAGFDQLVSTIYSLLKLHSVANIIPLIAHEVPIETFTAQQEATKVMYKVWRCVFNVNHLQAVAFLNASDKTINVNSDKLKERHGGLTFLWLICDIDSVDIHPRILQKKNDLQFCLHFTQHQYTVTIRFIETLSSSHKFIKTTDRG